METIDTLPIHGGHPVVDFVNTIDGDPTIRVHSDYLTSYEDLVTWARRVEVLPAGRATSLRKRARAEPEVAAGVLERARELRGALDAILRASAAGRRAPAGRLEVVAGAYRDALGRAALGYSGERIGWRPAAHDDLAAVLWPVTSAATELLTSPELARVRRCGECLWLFFDLSRNRSRRWCSMEACGTSVKKRRYIERRRGARGR